MKYLFSLLMLALFAGPAAAHKASDAYLQLQQQPDGITLRWDIALRDLDAAIDLDTNGDGQLTWGEIKAAWPRIEAYALPRLQIAGCEMRPAGQGLEQRSDGAYAVLRFASPCQLGAHPAISYALMRDVDPTHRGLLNIQRSGQGAQLMVLDPSRDEPQGAGAAQPASATPSFLHEGVLHILTGYDHVLFLLCLLLTAVMRRTPQGWQPVDRLPQALLPIFGIVTSFTIAHSITLGLAATGQVTLPSWFIEPAIAVTIIVAAIDNLHPLFRGRRGVVTFFFGLIHGFGFAGALAELNLPTGAFAWALLQFNLGLELGQLAIVLVAVGLLYTLRRRTVYPRWVIGGGSTVAIVLGAMWLLERTTGLALLPV